MTFRILLLELNFHVSTKLIKSTKNKKKAPKLFFKTSKICILNVLINFILLLLLIIINLECTDILTTGEFNILNIIYYSSYIDRVSRSIKSNITRRNGLSFVLVTYDTKINIDLLNTF